MLSERLRELEREAIVSRTVLPNPPIRVEYALTDKGHELHTTLAAVARWADRWVTGDAPSATSATRGSSVIGAARRAAAKTKTRERGAAGSGRRRQTASGR
jgi:DNA-binding PadR family transcriptional regulator